MKIGFTGTQKGMTPHQHKSVYLMLSEELPEEIHHGDCIGADDEVHNIASELRIKIVIHPPIKGGKRAFRLGDESRPEQHYLVRNQQIVNETDVLIATPKSNKEELRSGTWSTIRYAMRETRMAVRIVWPNGNVSIWNEGGEMDGLQASKQG